MDIQYIYLYIYIYIHTYIHAYINIYMGHIEGTWYMSTGPHWPPMSAPNSGHVPGAGLLYCLVVSGLESILGCPRRAARAKGLGSAER